jgi:putative restriction endonuclease
VGFAVFMHRPDSRYEDIPEQQYQFPRMYLDRALGSEGDWIVYLEPSRVPVSRGYFALARVDRIVPDASAEGMFLALIAPGSYLEFGDPVPLRGLDGYAERGLLNAAGVLSGRAQAAVRPLNPADFARIVERGLGAGRDVLPRVGPDAPGWAEDAGAFDNPAARVRAAVLTSRPLRDRTFRRAVLRAYGEKCAVTGLRLINGGGRAEVEAAHIRPVERDGPDLVANGLALSGTMHWMFDRGLLGLSDDLKILVSRHVNDPDAVRGLINPTGHLLSPARAADRPRRSFVAWHRENCFKH